MASKYFDRHVWTSIAHKINPTMDTTSSKYWYIWNFTRGWNCPVYLVGRGDSMMSKLSPSPFSRFPRLMEIELKILTHQHSFFSLFFYPFVGGVIWIEVTLYGNVWCLPFSLPNPQFIRGSQLLIFRQTAPEHVGHRVKSRKNGWTSI